jgi:FixJ family two-component response regulator
MGHVFLIDDDPSVRKGLGRLIRAAGFQVEALPDAAAYLARPAPVLPACLVVDIRMPDMSGFELQAAIAGTAWALPIVFVTGHGDEDARAQALATGAVDVLFKPIDQAVLVDAIERALGMRPSGATGTKSD